MKLSTRGRYATRILLAIARMETEDSPVSKRRISEEEGISIDYVEQIVVPLRNAGLVHSLRGLRGGFRMEKPPSQITIFEILCASEGDINLVGCLSGSCRFSETCVTQRIWKEASELLKNYFSGITLQDLLDDYAKMQQTAPVMFEI